MKVVAIALSGSLRLAAQVRSASSNWAYARSSLWRGSITARCAARRHVLSASCPPPAAFIRQAPLTQLLTSGKDLCQVNNLK